MEREDDVELIRKILSGDDAAFSILVEKYQESIHALAWRNIHDFHYAEEIMQDTFLKAYKKLPTLKNPDQFAGWLHVIAKHLCIDWVRKQKPTMQSLEGTRQEEIEESSYTQHLSEQRMTERTEYCHELVQQLLEKLPENERTVITLYYLDEMSTKEIGEFMGVSVNTITSRLQRARKRLQTDQELLYQEFFGHLQLSDNLKENIMSQLIKQIDEVECHISEYEQEIDELQKQNNIPAEWFTENFNADTYQFKTDVVKVAYQQVMRYHSKISVYLQKIGLTREALKSISNQIANGEADAWDVKMSVVEEHLKLVVSIAKKYRHQASGMEFIDLIREGSAGLMSAIDNFDYESGFKFKTYAKWWIRQSVCRAVFDNKRT